jgi:hypothetical protein
MLAEQEKNGNKECWRAGFLLVYKYVMRVLEADLSFSEDMVLETFRGSQVNI